ncbi:MAG: ribosome silencing factor [Treponemataceae bacterium]
MELSEKAIQIGKTLQDYKAGDVMVLDLTEKNVFTDYFIIATSNSVAHATGLEKKVFEEAEKLNLEETRKLQKISDGDEWKLIDLGLVVIHIMTETARKFYDLEKLWFDTKVLFKA